MIQLAPRHETNNGTYRTSTETGIPTPIFEPACLSEGLGDPCDFLIACEDMDDREGVCHGTNFHRKLERNR